MEREMGRKEDEGGESRGGKRGQGRAGVFAGFRPH